MQRAQRIDWIKATLEDKNADLYVGWDNKRKTQDNSRRVALVKGNYVVIIRLKNPTSANFITAYVADSGSTLVKIKSGRKWG